MSEPNGSTGSPINPAPGGPLCSAIENMQTSLYMVIETFKPGLKDAVYERFHRCGRMLPQGLLYVDSWLEKDGDRCFQLMQTEDKSLFDQWICHWNDLVDFEIVPIGPKPQNE